MTDVLSAADAAQSLRGLLPGRFFAPGDDGYAAASTPWNTAALLRPAAVAVPESVAEVQTVVRAAATAGLRLAPMSTGHAGMLLSDVDLSATVLVRLTSLTGVTVDEQSRIARVVGGTVWDDVIAAAHAHGLTGLHGSAGGIAVAGFALNGGISFYGRRHGLCANSVRAVEVVTADGELRRVDAEHDSELFWALRGGGGNFGIVTAVEVELVPYAHVVAGMMLWDRSRAGDVMRVWRDLTVDAPESVTTSLRVMSFPPLPDLPPFLAGRDVVVVDGALLESDERASELLEPLRALQPEMDTVRRIPTSELPLMHMDPPQPSPAVSAHCVLGELPDDAIDAYLDQVGPGTHSGLLSAELRQLGGAFARRAEDGGAVSSVEGDYALYAVAIAPTPEAVAHGRASAVALVQALEPWSLLHSRVPTFIDDAVDAEDVYGDACERLASVADRVDPHRIFQAGHSVR
jgi:FAD/FMN-containing dehydrogenase